MGMVSDKSAHAMADPAGDDCIAIPKYINGSNILCIPMLLKMAAFGDSLMTPCLARLRR